MSIPKCKFPGGGSVHRYFYTAMQAIWNGRLGNDGSDGFGIKLRNLKIVSLNKLFKKKSFD